MPHPEMKPLPNPGDYEDAAIEVQKTFGPEGVEKGILAVVNRYTSGRSILYQERAKRFALENLNPVDHVSGRHQERDIAAVFSQGVMAGIAIVRFAHDSKAPHQLLVPVNRVEGEDSNSLDDPLHSLMPKDSTVLTESQDGLDLMNDTAQSLIEHWSENVIADEHLRHQRNYMLGCGFVAIRAYTYMQKSASIPIGLESATNDSWVSALGSNFDWDNALVKLIESDTSKND